MMKKPSWINILFCMLALIHLVNGGCTRYDFNSTSHTVQCKCTDKSLDLDVTHEYSVMFVSAESIEITECRNVTLRANLFRRAYILSSLSLSEIDNLFIDPALSLPHSLTTFKLSHVGFLNHFPVPGPNSALLHSLAALELFSLENVTVPAPPPGSTSSFIDLPIAKVDLNSVKFIGTLPKGALEFNCTEMVSFNAFKCHFGNMNESSFLVNTKENFQINKCDFGEVMAGAIKVFGQNVSLDGNSFQYLSGSPALSVRGRKYISLSDNKFGKLGGPRALALDAEVGASAFVNNNQLPCGCYADNFILSISEKVNDTSCKSKDSLACALLQKQDCLFPNGKKEKIQIFTSDVPNCPDTGIATVLGNHYIRFQLYSIILCFINYFVL